MKKILLTGLLISLTACGSTSTKTETETEIITEIETEVITEIETISKEYQNA